MKRILLLCSILLLYGVLITIQPLSCRMMRVDFITKNKQGKITCRNKLFFECEKLVLIDRDNFVGRVSDSRVEIMDSRFDNSLISSCAHSHRVCPYDNWCTANALQRNNAMCLMHLNCKISCNSLMKIWHRILFSI